MNERASRGNDAMTDTRLLQAPAGVSMASKSHHVAIADSDDVGDDGRRVTISRRSAYSRPQDASAQEEEATFQTLTNNAGLEGFSLVHTQ
jgi:hypothetical protein